MKKAEATGASGEKFEQKTMGYQRALPCYDHTA